MPVAAPQSDLADLPADAHRVLLAGDIAGLRYPAICPHCAAPAGSRLPIAKLFQHHQGPDEGWRYRIVEAAPLFCDACLARHRAEAEPVTPLDRLRSVVLSELAIPAIGSAAFGLYLLLDIGLRPWRNLARDWPLAAFPLALFALAAFCLRAAWLAGAHRRVPRQSPTSRAFDFGDDDSNLFHTQARTYAIRNPAYARELARLNADRSAILLGPVQRRRDDRRFWIAAAIVAAVSLLAYAMK